MDHIHRADDWFAQGFHTMQARDVFPGDDYLATYVEMSVVMTCQRREDPGNGYIELDGVGFQAEQRMWVRKH